ncbi:MAG TPA: hypothetical protein P5323_03910 [Candidatus Moranbacteria bacterium]|nr:hypothetical protein [Candidatus Moranbacteria bacterium]HRY28257.1 hypothetical protein [Candidatus Moranbacteria bacterium]HSA08346.1 hypothetical protein [Candidatus Moranbacteria bacterium]
MNQNVIAYLKENKDKYSQEALFDQLKKAGYSEQDIQDGVSFVYNDSVIVTASSKESKQPVDFWDFKTPKIYAKSSEKWADFLFGLFAPWVVGFVSSFITLIGPFIALIFYITALIYLFNRRRFIFYGLLVEMIVILMIIFIVLTVSFGGYFSTF